jgi:hypothetical protein
VGIKDIKGEILSKSRAGSKFKTAFKSADLTRSRNSNGHRGVEKSDDFAPLFVHGIHRSYNQDESSKPLVGRGHDHHVLKLMGGKNRPAVV